MLTDKNHLEVRLVPNKEPEPAKDNSNIVVIASTAIVISIPLSFAFKLFEINPQFNPNIQLPEQVTFQPSNNSTTNNPSWEDSNMSQPPSSVGGPSNPSPTTTFFKKEYRRVYIKQCNGVFPEGANFRAYPTIETHAILGAVRIGEWVTLTGRTSIRDNIVWYEAINESALVPSLYSNGSYTSDSMNPYQVGWIAGCFVE